MEEGRLLAAIWRFGFKVNQPWLDGVWLLHSLSLLDCLCFKRSTGPECISSRSAWLWSTSILQMKKLDGLDDWLMISSWAKIPNPYFQYQVLLTIFWPHGRVLEQCHVQKNRATNNNGLRTWVLCCILRIPWKRPTFHLNTFKFPFCSFFYLLPCAL